MFKTETLKDYDVLIINDWEVGLLFNSALVKCAVADIRWEKKVFFHMCTFCGVFLEILGVSKCRDIGLFVDYQDYGIYKKEAVAE